MPISGSRYGVYFSLLWSLLVGMCLCCYRDFDVQLYVCNDAFRFLPWDTIVRLTENYLFPLYAAVHCVYVVYTAFATLHGWW